ncbi:dephospho-CoA kinase [Verminephrobacter aporrectodeae subsp. tuberculatae]|uniref:Dephospho-CoA kinase n=1 Tax=Verminephrobacter aporrectodeae subsp. tuberculatae TaxID=1110392 RepID=A0ABT3KUR3_9BURK|nr:dephospho-CoA kinase [Verminephrobacter aporrectodeae]MCW5322086.1 dephospho-CoA kinase [Verminephrobacter aporrectodeae subsp. tuberculatae]MCW8164561.1 dephospho-CoA kinase [Verminephrobacter aporrectodeae subsp. tuberculatae]MCW8170561.1 dephospho-CoA kinase [Verminephrobacter aporrectodeae subsp. tuberculatae]
MALRPRPLRLGLTGGIGSGKSTVGGMLAALGAALIDADQLAREVTGPQGAAMQAIRATFGAEYVDANGALDRARMRRLVFSLPQERARLEGIVHPLVMSHSDLLARQAADQGAALIVFDIPLLAESGRWARRLDAVLVVDCCAETQIARVLRRSGLARDVVQAIIAAQASRSARRAVADVVIANDADGMQALQARVRQMATLFGL